MLTEDASIAPQNKETIQKLQDKHPKELCSFVEVPHGPFALLYSGVEEVSEVIRSFPNGSAAGCDGLSPQHIKDMFLNINEGPLKDKNIQRFTNFINHIINEKMPDEIRQVFYGAQLIALNKKDGGVRPIAIGNTLRRICAKIVNRRGQKAFLR